MATKALVLMSGGLDSTTCLYWAKDKFDEVTAMTFNYFRRSSREKLATRRITTLANVKLIKVEVPFLKEKSEYSIARRKTISGPSQSYIPLRNLIFYSIAGYFAQVKKIQNLVGGHRASDGEVFKDAKSSYLRTMNNLISQGLLGALDCKIILPLKNMSLTGVIRMAMSINAPIKLTWSCHGDDTVCCGYCYACKQRLNAFKMLGLADPASYVSPNKG